VRFQESSKTVFNARILCSNRVRFEFVFGSFLSSF
jgi:hypothetical protein